MIEKTEKSFGLSLYRTFLISTFLINSANTQWNGPFHLPESSKHLKTNSHTAVFTHVSIKNGSIRGVTKNDRFGNEVDIFFGIPFARPPTHSLRFQLPQEHPGWQGSVLDASAGVTDETLRTFNKRICVQGAASVKLVKKVTSNTLILNIFMIF